MKIKNNVDRTVQELVDLIGELQELKGNGDYKYLYALGTIQAILDWEVKGYNKGFRSLQETINGAYDNVNGELQALKNGVHALQSDRDHKMATLEEMAEVCNKSTLEELYA
jgi:phage-related tail protein